MKEVIAIILGLLIFTVTVGTFGYMMYNNANVYNRTVEAQYSNVFAQANETFTDTETLASGMSTKSQTSEGITSGDSSVSIPTGILSAVRSVFGTIGITKEIGTATLEVMPLPKQIISGIMVGILITITLVIVGVIIDR